MKSKPTSTPTWSATRYQHLYRHKSGKYYARLTLNGKKTWRSLKTEVLSIARPRLSKLLEDERERLERSGGINNGSISVGDAVLQRLQEIQDDASLKKSTIEYYEFIHLSLMRSWPELGDLDIRDLTPEDCRTWAAGYARKVSPTIYNNTISALKKALKIGIDSGLRTTNPANDLRRRKPNKKELGEKLPNPEQFKAWTTEIRKGRSRWAPHCADLVEFLAYSGLRLGEAKHVEWRHCDFKRGELLVTGDPENEGTKNRESRRVPMIPPLRKLLERLREAQDPGAESHKVLQVFTAKDAMRRAAKVVGMAPITHHDLRHLFATTCIESGVDIPTVSRWLGHKDGGALAMRVYGHLRNEHSLAAAQKVTFD